MDHWDPLMTDGLAAGREVILYDYRGCASSTGAPRNLIEDIVNGVNDVMIATINSWHMVQNIPNAQLIVYPDAGHGAQFQYPDRFLNHAIQFLAE
jgi:pimeloyl-ACP methyl ester carboxylesterase